MINTEILKKISLNPSASFAIWSENFGSKDCLERESNKIYLNILEQKNKLKPELIFLGLNRSGNNPENKIAPFSNFHYMGRGCNDHFLSELIKSNPKLIGAFMTDIDVDTIETDSNKVILSSNHLNKFIEELKIFNIQKFEVFCFGDKVFNLFKDNDVVVKNLDNNIELINIVVNDIELNLYKIRHYSNRNKYYKEELKKQIISLK